MSAPDLCDTCSGKGTIWAPFALHKDGGCKPATLTCYDCKGTGLERGQREWKVTGQECRRLRVDVEPYESLGDVARRSGISVVEVSEMERGKADPARLVALMQGKR